MLTKIIGRSRFCTRLAMVPTTAQSIGWKTAAEVTAPTAARRVDSIGISEYMKPTI